MGRLTMADFRVIIPFQFHQGRLLKTQAFADPTYLGDPVNMARIYRDLRADQVVLLDIRPGPIATGPDFPFLDRVLAELPLPVAYGGAIRHREDATALIHRGIDHLVFGSACWDDPGLVRAVAADHGRQAVMVSLDHRAGRCFTHGGRRDTGVSLAEALGRVEDLGAGEILVQDIARDGSAAGLDLRPLACLRASTHLPLLVGGGARDGADLARARAAGFEGALAGACAFFRGDRRAILPSCPRPGP
jgi:cyclase